MSKTKIIPKKVVLFIVEGVSDKQALSNILRKLYKNSREIKFEITNGDVTSNTDTSVDQVELQVKKIVRTYITDNKLRRNDIFQIIQIFDMDGAYIPNSAIIHGRTSKFIYSANSISCLTPKDVIVRNEHKRTLMDKLLSISEINGIPYEKYFMACNLDHVLYDEQNLVADDKLNRAYEFQSQFRGKEHLFPIFLKQSAGENIPDDMDKSWQYIKQDLHSLERNTNLHLYFALHPIIG